MLSCVCGAADGSVAPPGAMPPDADACSAVAVARTGAFRIPRPSVVVLPFGLLHVVLLGAGGVFCGAAARCRMPPRANRLSFSTWRGPTKPNSNVNGQAACALWRPLSTISRSRRLVSAYLPRMLVGGRGERGRTRRDMTPRGMFSEDNWVTPPGRRCGCEALRLQGQSGSHRERRVSLRHDHQRLHCYELAGGQVRR